MRNWTVLAVAIVGLAVGGGILGYALFPIDVRPSRVPASTHSEEPESQLVESKPTVCPKVSEDFARRATGAGSNVFERLPDGQIVRSGERPVPKVEATGEEREVESAFKDWDDVVSLYSKPTAREIGREDSARFSQALSRLPSHTRRESVRMAVNVLPPDNFGLIAALALDKSQLLDVIAESFDACLNSSSEAAKQAIRKIAQDKTHPMFVDAARIIDISSLSTKDEKSIRMIKNGY